VPTPAASWKCDVAIAESLVVAVMSYNRGRSLGNCIASVERSLPGVPVWIFDDASDDAETGSVLATLATRHQIFLPPTKNPEFSHLGGLYGNMNRALDKARAESVKYVFFIQDDIQVVRSCDAYFWEQCERMFSIEDILQINPLFYKGFLPPEHLAKNYTIDEEFGFYDCKFYGFCDVGIVDMAKAGVAGLRLQSSEGATAKVMRDRGFRLVCHRDPVAMYTPWPSTMRQGNWKQKCLQYINECGTRAGCHPFNEMTAPDIKRLIDRPISEFPTAEKFLTTATSLRKPWWYSSSFSEDKITDFESFIKLRWIFDGPPQYIDLCKKMNDNA
jgi:glycosyltransferase involved in cell wall biosynthesis